MSSSPMIVADSTISLPASLVADLPIFVVPFEVHHGGKVYTDGSDLDARSFYDLQRRAGTPPTTSAPQPGAFLGAFQRAARQSGQIICLTLSQDLSAAYQSALLAKEETARTLPDVQVHIVDTRTAGPAEGLVVLEAARQAAAGASTDAVLATISQRLTNVCLMAYVQTLYYVWKGGRVPRVAMWLGNLLDVKPILELSKGQIGMLERPRTERRARQRIVSLVAQRLGRAAARVAVVHADAPQQAEELAVALRGAVEAIELFVTEFTPVIGAHTGPGLVGCAFHPVETDP